MKIHAINGKTLNNPSYEPWYCHVEECIDYDSVEFVMCTDFVEQYLDKTPYCICIKLTSYPHKGSRRVILKEGTSGADIPSLGVEDSYISIFIRNLLRESGLTTFYFSIHDSSTPTSNHSS